MLIRIGDAVVNHEHVVYAWIDGDKAIKVQFKDRELPLHVNSDDPEADMKRLETVA